MVSRAGSVRNAIPATRGATSQVTLNINGRDVAFAIASAAVAPDVNNGRVRDVRIALGGVGTKPWR